MKYLNLCDGGRTLRIAFGILIFVGLLLISTSVAQIPPPAGGGGSSGGGGGINGSVAYGPMTWNASNFLAFEGNETLSVLNLVGTENRVIAEDNLEYLIQGQQEHLKVVKEKYTSAEAAAAAGLEMFGAGQMAPNAGNYTIVGWMGELYVAIMAKDYKLSRLLLDQDPDETKNLAIGETWNMSEGWELTLNGIDDKAMPIQAYITLSKDGAIRDNKVISSGTPDSQPIYTFVEPSLAGEINVPVFVTYADTISSDAVQLKYTWLISSNVTEIRAGDIFGLMKVVSTFPPITLKNSDTIITLARGSTINLMDGLYFMVNDSDDLEYYPMMTVEIPPTNVFPVHNLNTGENFSTIQAAIDDVDTSNENTITVDSGKYYENVNVTKQLILRGIDIGSGKPVVNAAGIGDAITLNADGITLDGFAAENASSSDGIRVSSNNNIIQNNTAFNNSFGIHLFQSDNNSLNSNNVSFSNYGILLSSSDFNVLKNNDVSNNNFGISLVYYSNDNLLYNNFLNNINNFNNIYNNLINNFANTWNISKIETTNIIGGPYLGGNYWGSPDGTGFSQTCTDNDKDGICDLPYTLFDNNIDYLPLAGHAAPPTGAPYITSFSPFSSLVMDYVGDARTFNIIINQNVNVSWQVNGVEVFSETGVTSSSYSNTSASLGTWNVNATAINENGMVSHEWTWTVAYGGIVVNLGQPIPGKSNVWALTRGVDGKIYGGTGEGGTLFVYDPITGISEPLGGVSGEDAVYSLATDENGLIYGGTAWNSKFFVYDPLNRSIAYLGQPIANGGIISSLAAKANDIYGSTSNGGDSIYVGSHLFVYDSKTGIFMDLGQPVAGEMASKITLGNDGKIYGGTSPNGYLFAYDPEGKAFTILGQPIQEEGIASIITGNDNKIYFSLSGSLYVFNPESSSIDKLFELRSFIPDSGEFFWSLTEGMDGNIYGGTAPSGYLFEYNPIDNSISLIRPLATETRIRALTTGIDGKIYGGTGWGAYLFSYDSGYDATPPFITFVSPTPANNSEVNVNYVNVSIVLNEPGFKVQLNWNGVMENMDGSGTNFFKNKTGLAKDIYGYYVYAGDATGNFNTSEIWRVTVNVTAPAPTTGSISGFKINDTSGNGKWDAGETGLQGWTITLKDAQGNTITTTTNSNGDYTFGYLQAGTYIIGEVSQPGWSQTTPAGGTYTVTIVSGDNITGKDFLNWRGVPPPPVPELPTIALMGLGMIGLLMMVRRKQ